FHIRAKALQEDLGLLNDVAVAETLLADLLARPGKQDIKAAAGVVIGWHAHAVAAIEPDIRRDWKAFASAPSFWRKA
ncbi:MAG: CYTH and CHAD domain-containing protein, partial [Geminicoccaceae bacterium]